MTFAQRLETAADAIDERLDTILGERRTGTDASAAWPPRLRQAMRHAALGGGKRIRPFLVIESAALFGLSLAQSSAAAAAIECVHCYSLAHDDLPAMDNDELRRGRPTVWKAFDEWTAILAGDALLTLAFEILAQRETHSDPAIRSDLVLTLARASGAGGMAGGQALDLAAGKLGDPSRPGIDHISRLQAMKTGALIACACEMGAVLGRASREERNALRRYGETLGRAFQIADDLLDAEGDAAVAGKAVAKDAAAGKATLVSALGVDAVRAELGRLETEAVATLSPFGKKAATLAEAARFVARRRT